MSGNSRALGSFRHKVKEHWHYWLMHRSRATLAAERLWQQLEGFFRLPPARIVHRFGQPQLQWSLSP
jgi:hypothetical protein